MATATFTGFVTAMSGGGSSYRGHPKDLESGGSGKGRTSVDLKQGTLVLNASRGFHCPLDLKMEEEKIQIIANFRAHARVIQAAYLFQAHGEKPDEIIEAPPSPILRGNYNVRSGKLRTAVMLKSNPRKKARRNTAHIHYHSNTSKGRVGENVNSAHQKNWMFKDNFGKWVTLVEAHVGVSGVWLGIIGLKFGLYAFEMHGWLLDTAVIALAISIIASCMIYYTENDLEKVMKDYFLPIYNMILNSVFWFAAILTHLSLMLVIILPHEIKWVEYAVVCPLYVGLFACCFIGLIKIIWERARG